MTDRYFSRKQLHILGQAVDIAEEMTSNFYKLSLSQWKRYPFDIKTLSNWTGENDVGDVFAFLKREDICKKKEQELSSKRRGTYIVCLQDHQIISALERDGELKLLPLLSYILTHELVHIVRFCNFQVSFELWEEQKRAKEEKVVHKTTYNILKKLPLSNLQYILDSYNPDKRNIDICMV